MVVVQVVGGSQRRGSLILRSFDLWRRRMPRVPDPSTLRAIAATAFTKFLSKDARKQSRSQAGEFVT